MARSAPDRWRGTITGPRRPTTGAETHGQRRSIIADHRGAAVSGRAATGADDRSGTQHLRRLQRDAHDPRASVAVDLRAVGVPRPDGEIRPRLAARAGPQRELHAGRAGPAFRGADPRDRPTDHPVCAILPVARRSDGAVLYLSPALSG